MRETLFRGKRTINGGWAEGYLVVCDERYFIMPKDTISCFYNEGVRPGKYVFGEFVEVCCETVEQFTGLTDKNGTRIFEGDIIKSDNGKRSAVSVVKFGDYFPRMFYAMLDMCVPGKRHLLAHGFYAVSIDKGEEMILFQSPCVEVIGNIHENPELLEAGDGNIKQKGIGGSKGDC